MATDDDVRRLALALPGVAGDPDPARLHFSLGGKGMVWPYLKRETPKSPRRPQPGMLAVRCPIEEKEMLIEAAPAIYFDDDHYRGYPAVLVRLDAIDVAELGARLLRAWEVQSSQRRPSRSRPKRPS